MTQRDNCGLLNAKGETINLREKSPPGSICKDGLSSSSSTIKDDCVKRILKWLRRDKLMILIVIGVLLGFLIGIACNKPIQNLDEPTKSTVKTLLGFPGDLLMRMLKMLILPLIVSSLIVGVADLDQRASGRIGFLAVVYYLVTTLLAVALGIVLVVSIKPGQHMNSFVEQKQQPEVRAIDSFLDLIRNMFPDNLIKACMYQHATIIKTQTIRQENITISNISALTKTQRVELKDYTFYTAMLNGSNITWYTKNITENIAAGSEDKSGSNILGLVVFSLALGLVIGNMGHKAGPFIQWINILNDVVMKLVSLVMWYSPIGILSLIAERFASMENISREFQGVGLYMVTVIMGLVIHSCLTLSLLYLIATRKNPLTFVKGMVKALLTAFGTSSSSATLPVTINCVEEINLIDKRVSRFVLPVGATINMDGTALYEAVAAIFIAQAYGLNLNFGQYIAVSLTSTLASIGAAGIPQAGLVTMMVVLQTIGLPGSAAGLILSVDWFLDRIRTVVNVLGDAIGAGIVAHLSEEYLREMDLHHIEQAKLELEGGLLIRGEQLNMPHLNVRDDTTVV